MAKRAKEGEFDHLIEGIEKMFLSGHTLAEVKADYKESGIPASHITKHRNALFARLRSDPQIVKDMANGPLLNANKVVRYSGMHRAIRSKIYQLSILDDCEAKN